MQNWHQIRNQIENRIRPGTDVNIVKMTGRSSTYRIVEEVNEEYIAVPVGESSNALEKYPWSLLSLFWDEMNTSEGFTREKMEEMYPEHLGKKPRPCSFHTIGQIFVRSRLAYLEESRGKKKAYYAK